MSTETPPPTPAAPAPAPTPAPPPAPPAPATPPAPPAQETDWKVEARKWEDRAKENKTAAEELAALKAAQMTDAEKAAARTAELEAKVKGYETKEQIAAWRKQVAEATGVPDAALSGATLEELQAHAEVLKPLIATEPPTVPYIVPTEGTQTGNPPASQLTQADIDQMTPKEINDARRAGRLNKYLGIT